MGEVLLLHLHRGLLMAMGAILLALLLSNHPYRAAATSSSVRGPLGVAGDQGFDPSANKTTACAAFMALHGDYTCQEYSATTKDGYILSFMRIPGRTISGDPLITKQPVLFQHGVTVDGFSFLLTPSDRCLPMILVDKGYDVWIANVRGTRYSRRHVSLDTSNPKYWDWTWDDLAAYDLSASIDLVVKETGQKTHYIGHSLGTLMILAAFSEGKLVDKVKSTTLLCPIFYIDRITTLVCQFLAHYHIGELGQIIGLKELNPTGTYTKIFVKAFCSFPGVNCIDLLSFFTGKNCCLEPSIIGKLLENEPQSTSLKNLVHLAQNVRNGKVTKYDYGNKTLNMNYYGVPAPPVYDVSKIPANAPLFLTHGGRDDFADVKDVKHLLNKLKSDGPPPRKLKVQFIEEFAHLDFVMGDNAHLLVYPQVIDFIKKYD